MARPKGTRKEYTVGQVLGDYGMTYVGEGGDSGVPLTRTYLIQCPKCPTIFPQKSLYKINTGKTQSCGCDRNARRNKALTKHGHTVGSLEGKSWSKEYGAWVGMRGRILDKNNKRYFEYGGRGLEIETAWAEDFQAFFDHVGYAPSKDHSLDRIDNDLGYLIGNVKWSTRIEQQENRKNTRTIKIHHHQVPLSRAWREWFSGLSYSVVENWWAAGLTFEEMLVKAERHKPVTPSDPWENV